MRFAQHHGSEVRVSPCDSRSPLRSCPAMVPVFTLIATRRQLLDHPIHFERLFASVGDPLAGIPGVGEARVLDPGAEGPRVARSIWDTTALHHGDQGAVQCHELGWRHRWRAAGVEYLARGNAPSSSDRWWAIIAGARASSRNPRRRLSANAFLGGERSLDRLSGAAQGAGARAGRIARGRGRERDPGGRHGHGGALRVISLERGYDPAEFVVLVICGSD